MSTSFVNWLVLIIRTVFLILGKDIFTRLSRYGGRTTKTVVNYFKTSVDCTKVKIGMTQDCFDPGDEIAVAIFQDS